MISRASGVPNVSHPIFEVGTFLQRAGDAIRQAYPEAEIVVVGHLGDGNLHDIAMFDHAKWAGLPDKDGCRRSVGNIVYDAESIAPQMVQRFARTARERIGIDGGGYRRDHLRTLAQRVEVADGEVRIMGSKGDLLETLANPFGPKVLPMSPV